MTSISEALLQASEQFQQSDTSRLDAELLLAQLLKKPRTHLFCWPEENLTKTILQKYHQLIKKRSSGVPIAHLTGTKEFWSRDFHITSDTLIPRPETELLIELALKQLPPNQNNLIADLGTGSGAIAITLAAERNKTSVIATDLSQRALNIAIKNADTHHIKNITFFLSNWFDALTGMLFQLVISNPPYIDKSDAHLKQGDVRFEPISALISDEKGLADIKKIAQQARSHLTIGGILLLEHGYNQAKSVQKILHHLGYNTIKSHHDLAGHLRVTSAIWDSNPIIITPLKP